MTRIRGFRETELRPRGFSALRDTIDNGIGGVAAPGEVEISPTANTTYAMTAIGCGGTVQKQVTVSVVSLPPLLPTLTTPPKIPLPIGDLIMEDIHIDTSNVIFAQVRKTGTLSGSFKYRIYRWRSYPFGMWIVVNEGTLPVPSAAFSYNTGYTFGPVAGFDSQVKVMRLITPAPKLATQWRIPVSNFSL